MNRCPSGYGWNTATRNCDKCASNQYTNPGSNTCVQCTNQLPNCAECTAYFDLTNTVKNVCLRCSNGYSLNS